MIAHPRPPLARDRRRRGRVCHAAFVESLERRQLLAAVSWDGGGDRVDWNDPLNWSADTVPGRADDVTIDLPITGPAVEIAAGFAWIHSLTCDGPLTINGGLLWLDAASTVRGTFTLSSGELAGDGNLTLAGNTTWSGGDMTGSGRTILAPDVTMTLTGDEHTLTSRPLDSRGVVHWLGGELVIGSGGSFNNFGLLDLPREANCAMTRGAGGGTFNNSGTVSVGSLSSLEVGVPGANAGAISIASGGLVELRASFTHAVTSTVDGEGRLALAGGTHTFAAADAALAVGTIDLTGDATINGAGIFSVRHTFNWLRGTWSGSGRIVVRAGGVLNLASAYPKLLLDRPLDVDADGRVIWKSGELAIAPGASFNNRGRLDFGGPPGTYRVSSTGPGAFNNYANVEGTAAGGQVNIASGSTLRLSAPGSNAGKLFLAGGATLVIENDFTHAGFGTISGSGTLTLAGGVQTLAVPVAFGVVAVNFTGGTITGPGDFSIGTTFSTNCTWSGGTWGGSGRIVVTTLGRLKLPVADRVELGRSVENSGTIVLSPGELAIAAGRSFTNSRQIQLLGPAGMTYKVTAGAGGTFNNISGSQTTLASNSTLRIAAPGTSGGTLSLNSGSLVFEADIIHTNETISGSSSSSSLTYAAGTQTYTTNATVSGPTINLTGGTIAGAGNFTVSAGTFNWSGGTMLGPGHTVLNNPAVLNLITPGAKYVLGRSLDSVGGRINWSSGEIAITNGASFTVSNSSFFSSSISLTGPTGANYVISSSGGGTFVSNASSNTLVTVPSGASLRLAAPGTLSGAWAVSNGATLTLDADLSLAGSLNVTGLGMLVLSGGVKTLTASQSFSVKTTNLTGGTITGAGSYTINNALNWSGGTWSGIGKLIVQSNGVVTLPTVSAGTRIEIARSVDNFGRIVGKNGDLVLSGPVINNGGQITLDTANLSIGRSSTFSNTVGGRVTRTLGDVSLGAGATINNSGQFTVGSGNLSLAAGATVNNNSTITWYAGNCAIAASAAFNNAGLLNLPGQVGTVFSVVAEAGGVFNEGSITIWSGSSLRIAAPGTASGRIEVPADSLLTFEASVTHTGTIVGDGTLNFAGGTQTFPAPETIAVKTTNLSGGSMGGPGTVTFTRTLNWLTTALMTGGGQTVIAAGGTLNMPGGSGQAGAGTYTLGRVLDNKGVTNWTGGDLALTGGGSGLFNNNATVFVGAASGTFAITAEDAAAAFNNASAAAVVNVVPGATLSLRAGGSNAGRFALGAGASMLIEGNFTHAGGSRIDTATPGGDASLTLRNGVQNFTGDVVLGAAVTAVSTRLFVGGKLSLTKPFSLSGGELFVEPAASVVPSGAFTVTASKVGGPGAIAAADYLNADALRLPDSAGIANFAGNYVQTPNATMELRLDADLPRYERVAVAGSVTLAGTLDLPLADPAGFNPAPGTTFTLLENGGAAPIVGSFANYPEGAQFPLGSAGRRFSITYRGGNDGNDVLLTALGDPPSVTTLSLVGGVAQRSQVGSATLSFDAPVVLGPGAVRLLLLNTGGSGADDGSPPTDASDAVSPVATSLDGGFTWVVTFSATKSPFVQNGGLVDGVYQLRLDPAKVTAGGVRMTASPTLTFHRLFGDFDGDGTVNNADFASFRSAFGQSIQQPGYDAAFDFDGNRTVNMLDFAQFRNRFGKVLMP